MPKAEEIALARKLHDVFWRGLKNIGPATDFDRIDDQTRARWVGVAKFVRWRLVVARLNGDKVVE